MANNNAKLAKSSLLLTGSFAIERVAQLLAQIVLARLLSPEDFGIWAMVLLVTRLSEQFKDQATTTVLVYKGLEDKKLVNAVYSLTVNISLAMFVLQIIAGVFVAWFFGEPKVWQLNACAALVFLLGAGSGSHGAVLQRQMKFKELAIADSVGGLARFGSAIATAAMGWGVWSFAISEVAMTIALAILRRWFSKYSFKYYFSPDPIAVKEVKGYISKIIGVNLAVYANTNSDNLLIGKLIGTQALGYYNIAYQLAMLPTFALSKINQINFSVLSQQDKEGKQVYLGKILEIYALIYSLLYGLGFIVSPWLIPTVYGKDWTPAVILFQIILVFAYARGLMSILGTTLNALNKPGTNAKINWLLVPFSIPAFYIGAQWKGVEGVAIAAALVMGIVATIWFWFATCRSAEWSLTILIKPVLIPTISMILAIGSVLVIPFPTSWQIILQPLVLVVIYGIALSLFSAGRIPLMLIRKGLGVRG
jgi:lipopolysaccharide exporter